MKYLFSLGNEMNEGGQRLMYLFLDVKVYYVSKIKAKNH